MPNAEIKLTVLTICRCCGHEMIVVIETGVNKHYHHYHTVFNTDDINSVLENHSIKICHQAWTTSSYTLPLTCAWFIRQQVLATHILTGGIQQVNVIIPLHTLTQVSGGIQ